MPYASDYGFSIAGQLPATESAVICSESPDALPSLRWAACLDEGDLVIGFGPTRSAAIADLVERLGRVEG